MITNVRRTDNYCGTSFHGVTIATTLKGLTSVIGKPDEGDGDKTFCNWCVDFDFEGKTITATVYDWKEHSTFDEDEEIEWHIGGSNAHDCVLLKVWLMEEISKK